MSRSDKLLPVIAVLMALTSLSAGAWTLKQAPIMTRWAAKVDPNNTLPEYPRPQMTRADWLNLNGVWQFQSGSAGDAVPVGKNLSQDILVPFPVESAISGVMKHSDRLWYRRTFVVPAAWSGKRIMLNFGAVDFESEVYINGKSQGIHKGGYDPFGYDITQSLTTGATQELIVRVYDPTEAGGQPRGKQTTAPGGIMYTPSTGIWQSVWLEPVPQIGIGSIKIVPDVDNAAVKLTVTTVGSATGASVYATVKAAGTVVLTATGNPNAEISLSLPAPKLWSPENPFLYDLGVALVQNGSTLDSVGSYFGMRKVSLSKTDGYYKMLLNNQFTYEIGPLDQGFWPDGIYTAPTDDALKFDLTSIKALGFNMVRKHIKVEPYRWYYWADKVGLLVWQDMPSADSYISNPPPVDTAEFSVELKRMILTHWNSPCIIMWDVFNEAQGQHNTVNLVNMVHELDPSRLVNEASGGVSFGAGQVQDIHSYPAPACPASTDRANACGEYGGIGYQINSHVWNNGGGYQNVTNSADYLKLYNDFIADLVIYKSNAGMSAAVYTQITDVETELNGLLTYDRAVFKADSALLRAATLKARTETITLTDVLPTSQKQAQTWRYATTSPASTWTNASFDDGAWSSGPGGFGTAGTPGAVVKTTWNTADIWLRRQFNPGALTATDLADLVFSLHHDEDCEVYINGVQAAKESGYTSSYSIVQINQAGKNALQSNATNTLAVHCHQTDGGQYIDVGISKMIVTDNPVSLAPRQMRTTVKGDSPLKIRQTPGMLTLSFALPGTTGLANISVYNSSGEVLRRWEGMAVCKGENKLALKTQGLSSGFYTVHISVGSERGTPYSVLSKNFVVLNK